MSSSAPSSDAAGGVGHNGCMSHSRFDEHGRSHRGYAPSGYGYSGHHQQSPQPSQYPTYDDGSAAGYTAGDAHHPLRQQELMQAQSWATPALVLGIVGLFTVPFILGPLALWQASKARRVGHDASAGWVLGWICTLWGAAVLLAPLILVGLFLGAVSS